MKRKLTRREFLDRGCLVALAVGLVACAGLECLADITPVEPMDEAVPSSAPPSLPTDGRVRPVDGPPLSVTKDEPVPKGLHEARYYVQLEGERVQCQMCFRRCVVPGGGRGFCRNKVNWVGRCVFCDHSIPGVWWNA